MCWVAVSHVRQHVAPVDSYQYLFSKAVELEWLQEIWYRTNPLLRAMPLLCAVELGVDLDAEVLIAGDDF